MVLPGAISRGDVHLSNGMPASSGQGLPNGSHIRQPGTKSNFGFPGKAGYHRQVAGEKEPPSFSAKDGVPSTPKRVTRHCSSPDFIQSTGHRVRPHSHDWSQPFPSGRPVEKSPIALTRVSSSAKQLSVSASRKAPTSDLTSLGSEALSPKQTMLSRLSAPRKPGVLGGPWSKAEPNPEDAKVARSAVAARRGSPSPRQMAFSSGPADTVPAHSDLPVRRRSPSPVDRAGPSPRCSGTAPGRRSPSSSRHASNSRGEVDVATTGEGFMRRVSPSRAVSPCHERESGAPGVATGLPGRRASSSPRGQGIFSRGRSGGSVVAGALAARRGSPSSRGQDGTKEGVDGSFVQRGRRSPSPGREAHLQADQQESASRLGVGHMHTGSARKLPSPRAAGPAVATRGGASARALASPRRQANGGCRPTTHSTMIPGPRVERSSVGATLMPGPAAESRLERVSAPGTPSRSLLAAVAPGRSALLGTDLYTRGPTGSVAVPSSHLERTSNRRLAPPGDQDGSDSRLGGAGGAGAGNSRRVSTTPRKARKAASKEATSGQASSKDLQSAQSRAVESPSSRQVRSLTPSRLSRANSSVKLTPRRESAPAQRTDASTSGGLLQRTAPNSQRQSPRDRQAAHPASMREASIFPSKEEGMTFPRKAAAGSLSASVRSASSPSPRRQSMSPRQRRQSPRSETTIPAVKQAASALPGKHSRLLMRKDHGLSTAAPGGSKLQRDIGAKKQITPRGELLFARKAAGTNGKEAGQEAVAQLGVRNGSETADLEDGSSPEVQGSTGLPKQAANSAAFSRGNPFRREKSMGSLGFPKQSLLAPGQVQPAAAGKENMRGVSAIQPAPESRIGKESSLRKLATSPRQREHGSMASGQLAHSASLLAEPSAAPEKRLAKTTPSRRTISMPRQSSAAQSEAAGAKTLSRKTKVTISPREVAESSQQEGTLKLSTRAPGMHSARALASPRLGVPSPSLEQPQSSSALQKGSWIMRERVREKVSNLLKEMGSLPGRRTMSAPAPKSDRRHSASSRKRGTSDGNLSTGVELSPKLGKQLGNDEHCSGQTPTKAPARSAGATTPKGGKKPWHQRRMSLVKKASPTGQFNLGTAPVELAAPRSVDLGTASGPEVSDDNVKQSHAPTTTWQAECETALLAGKHSTEPERSSVFSPTSGQRKLEGPSAVRNEGATRPAQPPPSLPAPLGERQPELVTGEQPEPDQRRTALPTVVSGGHLGTKGGFHQGIHGPGGHEIVPPSRPQSPSPLGKRQASRLWQPSGHQGQPASPEGVTAGHEDSFSGFVPSRPPAREEASVPDERQLPSMLNEAAAWQAEPGHRQPPTSTGPEGRLAPPAASAGAGASPALGSWSWRQTSPPAAGQSPALSSGLAQRPASPSSGIGRRWASPSSEIGQQQQLSSQSGSPSSGTGGRPASPSSRLAERPASPTFGAARQITPPSSPHLAERPASPVFGMGRQLTPPSSLLGGQPASLSSGIGRHLSSLSSGAGQAEPPLFAMEERPASPLFGTRRQPARPPSPLSEQPASPSGAGMRPASLLPSLGGLPAPKQLDPTPKGAAAATLQRQHQDATAGFKPVSAASVAVGQAQPSQLGFGQARSGGMLRAPTTGESSSMFHGLRAGAGPQLQGIDVGKAPGELLDSTRNTSTPGSRNTEATSVASVPSTPAPVRSNEFLQRVVAPAPSTDPQCQESEDCLASMDPKEDNESVQLFNTTTPLFRQQAEGQHAARVSFDSRPRSSESVQQSQDPDMTSLLGAPSPTETSSFEDAVEDEEESRGASFGSLEGCDPPMSGSLMSTGDSQVAASQETRSEPDPWDPLDSSPDPIAVEESSEIDEKNAHAAVKEKSQLQKELALLEDGLPGIFSDEDALSSLSLSSLVKDDCPSPPRVSIGDFEAGNPFYGVTDLSSDDDIVAVSTVQGRSVVPVPPEAWREDLFSPRRNPLFEQWAIMNAMAGGEQHSQDSQDADLPTRVDAVALRSGSSTVQRGATASESAVWPTVCTRPSVSTFQVPNPLEAGHLEHVQRGNSFFSLVDDSQDKSAKGMNASGTAAHQGFGAVFGGEFARAQEQAPLSGAQQADEPSAQEDLVCSQGHKPRESVDSDVADFSMFGPQRATSSCSQSRVSEASDSASVESSSTFVLKPPVVDSKLESELPTWQDTSAGSDSESDGDGDGNNDTVGGGDADADASCEALDSDPDLWSRPPRCPGASETSICTKELLEESKFERMPGDSGVAGPGGADMEVSMDSSDIHSSVFEYTIDSNEGAMSSNSKSGSAQFQQKLAQSHIQNLFYGCSAVESQPRIPKQGIPPPTNFGKVAGTAGEAKPKGPADVAEPIAGDAVGATVSSSDAALPVVSLTLNASHGSTSEDDEDDSILPPTPDAESNGKRVFGKSESDSSELKAALGVHYTSPVLNIESIDEGSVLEGPCDLSRGMGLHQESSVEAGGSVPTASGTGTTGFPGADRTSSNADIECHGDVYYERKGLLSDDDEGDPDDMVITDSPRSKDVKAPIHGVKLLKRREPPGRTPFAGPDRPASSTSTRKLSVQNWLSGSGPKSQCSDSLMSSNGSSQGPGAREPEFGPEPQSSDALHSVAESFDSSTQVSQSESGLSQAFTPKDEPLEAAFAQEGPGSRLRSASHRREDSASKERALQRGSSGGSGSNVVSALSSLPLADVLEDSPLVETATNSSAISLTDYRDTLGNRLPGRPRKSYSVSSEIEVDDSPPGSCRRGASRLPKSSSVEAPPQKPMLQKSSSMGLVGMLRRKISMSHSRRSSVGSTPRKGQREGVREFGCFAFLSPRARGSKG